MIFRKLKNRVAQQRNVQHPQQASPLRWLAFIVTLNLGLLLVSCAQKEEAPQLPATPATNAAPATNSAPAAGAVSPELAKLVGKWERPDGGYVLEVKGIDPSGKAQAAYYNPNPINVSRAAAYREQGTSKLVVELQDTGYPGCIYTLMYNPESDQLAGQYFQAAQQQTYEIVFTRLKE